MSVRATVYLDGLVAGIIGAAIIAIWFLFLDTVRGLPLYAPTVLGAALFLGEKDLVSTEGMQVSLKLTLMYTWVHGLVFLALGEIATLVLLAVRNPNFWLSTILLFAILEIGFVGTALMFAKPVFDELAWPMVMIGNFLAAAGMMCYLSLRHPNFGNTEKGTF